MRLISKVFLYLLSVAIRFFKHQSDVTIIKDELNRYNPNALMNAFFCFNLIWMQQNWNRIFVVCFRLYGFKNRAILNSFGCISFQSRFELIYETAWGPHHHQIFMWQYLGPTDGRTWVLMLVVAGRVSASMAVQIRRRFSVRSEEIYFVYFRILCRNKRFYCPFYRPTRSYIRIYTTY